MEDMILKAEESRDKEQLNTVHAWEETAQSHHNAVVEKRTREHSEKNKTTTTAIEAVQFQP
eukprot:3235901-Prorocentrum_lima.AAC.1